MILEGNSIVKYEQLDVFKLVYTDAKECYWIAGPVIWCVSIKISIYRMHDAQKVSQLMANMGFHYIYSRVRDCCECLPIHARAEFTMNENI